MRYRWLAFALLVGALAFVAAGCGGDDDDGGAEGSEDVSGTISIMATWGGAEQESFEAVIAGFNELYPNVTVNYTSAGNNLGPQLSTAVSGGSPPDLAAVAQPGLMADFAESGELQSMDDLREAIVSSFGESVADVGNIDGTQYGLMFKGANKSTVWYNVSAFEEAGVEPAETWEDLIAARDTLLSAGITPFSVGVDAGWPITDIFENVYLRSAGPEMYDQLARHEIPWTDQSVKDALTIMQDIVGESDYMAGGTEGALQTAFDQSATNVFRDPPEGAMLFLGDFAPGVADTTLEAGTGYDVFATPAIEGSAPAVMGGGDLFIKFADNPATNAFLEYLTTADAAQIWAERGGFSSPNRDLDVGVYPDELTQTTAGALAEAETFRFDMSDLQPASFGGTPGQGLWKHLTDFVANPDNIDSITEAMEADATKAFG
jgi:alpha-glucoside transport system substrate-binding protein